MTNLHHDIAFRDNGTTFRMHDMSIKDVQETSDIFLSFVPCVPDVGESFKACVILFQELPFFQKQRVKAACAPYIFVRIPKEDGEGFTEKSLGEWKPSTKEEVIEETKAIAYFSLKNFYHLVEVLKKSSPKEEDALESLKKSLACL